MSNPDPRPLGLSRILPAGLLGFLAVSWQIFLLREFSAVFYGTELTFGFVLAAWLLWGGLGGLAANRGILRRVSLGALFDLALLAAPLCFAALRGSRWVLGVLPGELTGLLPILAFALAVTLLINFPLGAAFVKATQGAGNDVSRVYLWESAGAAAGGFLSYGVLVPFLSNWTALAVLQVIGTAANVLFVRKKKGLAWTAALLAGAALLTADVPFQKLVWRPFNLVESRDDAYGKLQVVRDAEQTTVYDNGLKAFSVPDPGSAEESIHFPMLLHPRAGTVLLIGGGLGGGLAELLKYPGIRIDYVELDAFMIATLKPFLPPAERSALENPRVRTITDDGRAFLERSAESYDVIIACLPDPATAQLNRYYTAEFFRIVRSKLKAGGVFSFKASSSENYLGPPLRRYLATLAATLRSVFPAVNAVPGGRCVFLASENPLPVDAAVLSDRMTSWGIAAATLTPESLRNRLHPLRMEGLKKALLESGVPLNTDLKPASYYFHALLWSAETKGPEAVLLRALAGMSPWALLGIPLLAAAAVLARAGLKPKRGNPATVLMAMLGLSTIVVEIILVVWFQALHGSFYGRVASLLTAFMAGLALGAAAGVAKKKPAARTLIILQLAFIALLVSALAGTSRRPGSLVFHLFLLCWGSLSGIFFVAASRVYPQPGQNAARGYAWDLLGSFAGAVVLSAVLIPLVGLRLLLVAVFVLNALVLLFLMVNRYEKSSNESA